MFNINFIKNRLLEFYLSKETIKRSKFNKINLNDNINLELPLKYGQKISGHVCQGHVDTTAKVKKISIVDKSYIYEFLIPKKFKKYLIEKASNTYKWCIIDYFKSYQQWFSNMGYTSHIKTY